MKHFMSLQREPFEKIASGKKTIELRLYDEKRKAVAVGDVIVFSMMDDNSAKLEAKVTALHIFGSFKELYETLPLSKCGYSETENASYTDMEAYYPKEKQTQYGVVGIELRLI
ncbi:MAG: ASCH domain-containing protein [Clostridia bacterium]|nr:ASCH domain-containing protein [Clostridia bacterium]